MTYLIRSSGPPTQNIIHRLAIDETLTGLNKILIIFEKQVRYPVLNRSYLESMSHI